MECMFLGYEQNHTVCTHHMLNLCTTHIILICDVIWPNKTYGDYVSREKTKATSYTLQDEYKSYNWAHVTMDPANNEGKTDNIKIDQNVNTKQGSMGVKYL